MRREREKPVTTHGVCAALFAGAACLALATTAVPQDDVAAARERLASEIEAVEQDEGKTSPSLIPLLADYADLVGEPGSPGKQIAQYRRAIRISEAHYGADAIAHAELLLRAGEGYLKDAEEIFASTAGDDDAMTGLARFYLGRVEFSGKNFRRSAEYLESALNGFPGTSDEDRKYQLLIHSLLVADYEYLGDDTAATRHCRAIGAGNMLDPDQDYLPIFRVAPVYPASALKSRSQGHVDLAFTVTDEGRVDDIQVVGGKSSQALRKAAIDAVRKFRYAPRYEGGVPIAVDNVKTRITFEFSP